MKKQTKQLWTGSISYTAADPIGGAMLRGNSQEDAPDIIGVVAKYAFMRSLRAVMKEVKKVTATQLWDDIEIIVTLTIKPQTK